MSPSRTAARARAARRSDRRTLPKVASSRAIRRGSRERGELPRRAEVGFIRLRPCLVAKSGKPDFAGERVGVRGFERIDGPEPLTPTLSPWKREPAEPAAMASIETRVAGIIIAPA